MQHEKGIHSEKKIADYPVKIKKCSVKQAGIQCDEKQISGGKKQNLQARKCFFVFSSNKQENNEATWSDSLSSTLSVARK